MVAAEERRLEKSKHDREAAQAKQQKVRETAEQAKAPASTAN